MLYPNKAKSKEPLCRRLRTNER